MSVMVLDASYSIVHRMAAQMIVLEATQIGGKPVRSSDLPKGVIGRNHRIVS